MTFDVCSRVGLGVAQAGGVCQHLVVVRTGGVHRIEDEVGGAVDNAHDLIDSVTGQRTAQRADDRNSCSHSSLKEKVDA